MTSIDVGAQSAPDEPPTVLYIGQHESQRDVPVTRDVLRAAQDVGYDMLTAPITNSHFQSRILARLEEHVNALSASSNSESVPMPLISPLTPQDTDLAPEESNSSLIAVTSPWIELGSPDPLIAHTSRQVFGLEVAYAAFCGISNVMVHGPISSEGTMQYARAVREALGLGPYLQLHIVLSMTGELEQDVSAQGTHLSELTREQYAPQSGDNDSEPELYGTWEAWDSIRTLCDYGTRLSIGTKASYPVLTEFPFTFSLASLLHSNMLSLSKKDQAAAATRYIPSAVRY